MNQFFWLFIALLLLAAALRSELFFYLLYVLVGLQLLSRLWLRRSTASLTWRRTSPQRAFIGEPVTVALELTNTGLLPLPWLSVQESVAAPLRPPPGVVREVLTLGAGQTRRLEYQVVGQRRGYFRLGPLQLRSGDVLGLEEQSREGEALDALTIFPQVLPLAELGLPATLPFGTRASHERLFADPSRPAGTRDFQAGDGVRRIDWKSSARAGALQVRRYDPAIAIETLVALAFSREEYAGRYAYDEMERAIVAAASVAGHLALSRLPVGLCSSGVDAATGAPLAALPVGHGREHLYTVLAALGRLEPARARDGAGLSAAIWAASAQLSWGSTVVVISGQRADELIQPLLGLKRRGLNVALLQVDAPVGDLALARGHGITAYRIDRAGRPSER
jgi:uncharacterized protein (DUF58 family)